MLNDDKKKKNKLKETLNNEKDEQTILIDELKTVNTNKNEQIRSINDEKENIKKLKEKDADNLIDIEKLNHTLERTQNSYQMEITSKDRNLHSLQNELNTIVETRKKERQMHNKELDEIH